MSVFFGKKLDFFHQNREKAEKIPVVAERLVYTGRLVYNMDNIHFCGFHVLEKLEHQIRAYTVVRKSYVQCEQLKVSQNN